MTYTAVPRIPKDKTATAAAAAALKCMMNSRRLYCWSECSWKRGKDGDDDWFVTKSKVRKFLL